MTTTMTEAAKAAGIAVPEIQRVWRFIADNPGATVRGIAAGTRIASENVSPLTKDLIDRRMAEREKKPDTLIVNGVRRRKEIYAYTVPARTRLAIEGAPGEFELWPLPRTQKQAAIRGEVAPPLVKAHTMEPVALRLTDSQIALLDDVIEKLTPRLGFEMTREQALAHALTNFIKAGLT